jgi:hypothetical protein
MLQLVNIRAMPGLQWLKQPRLRHEHCCVTCTGNLEVEKISYPGTRIGVALLFVVPSTKKDENSKAADTEWPIWMLQLVDHPSQSLDSEAENIVV